jgi:hypothetical protein
VRSPTKSVKLRLYVVIAISPFTLFIPSSYLSLCIPHGMCWFTVNFKFKKSFFGVQRSAKSTVLRWNKQWIISIKSKSLHEEVCILILISYSVVQNIHLCMSCLVHVPTISVENIGRYTRMHIWKMEC